MSGAVEDLARALEDLRLAVWRQLEPLVAYLFPPPRVVAWGGRAIDIQLDSDADLERADRMDAEARAARRRRDVVVKLRLNLDADAFAQASARMNRAAAAFGLRMGEALDSMRRAIDAAPRARRRPLGVSPLEQLGATIRAQDAAQRGDLAGVLERAEALERARRIRRLHAEVALKRGRHVNRLDLVVRRLDALELDEDAQLRLLLAAGDVGIEPAALLAALELAELRPIDVRAFDA